MEKKKIKNNKMLLKNLKISEAAAVEAIWESNGTFHADKKNWTFRPYKNIVFLLAFQSQPSRKTWKTFDFCRFE